MKRLFTCLMVLSLVSLSATAAVTFNDPNLQTAVETKLGIANPNEAEMLGLTELDAGSLGITDLTGLQYATNLTNLDLRDNLINDISLLAPLTKLEILNISDGGVIDISVVGNFTSLVAFSAGNNNIANLIPLQNLDSLLYLYIYGNNISSLAPLSGLTNLRDLDLGNNLIADISDLAGLTKLTYLNIGDNAITDINDLANIDKLKYFYVSYNAGLTNVSVIADMNDLFELGITATGISDLSPLANLVKLEILWASANAITDINDLANLDLMKILYLSYNPNLGNISVIADMNGLTEFSISKSLGAPATISDISLLSGMPNLEVLWLKGNTITDISPLLGLATLEIFDIKYNPLSFDSWTGVLKTIVSNNIPMELYSNPFFDDDYAADYDDLAILTSEWLSSGCVLNSSCNHADINLSGSVNLVDLAILADWWMYIP